MWEPMSRPKGTHVSSCNKGSSLYAAYLCNRPKKKKSILCARDRAHCNAEQSDPGASLQASLSPVHPREQQQTVPRWLLIVEEKRTTCTLCRNNMAATIHPLTNFKPAVEDIIFPLKHACSSQGTPSHSPRDSVFPWRSIVSMANWYLC